MYHNKKYGKCRFWCATFCLDQKWQKHVIMLHSSTSCTIHKTQCHILSEIWYINTAFSKNSLLTSDYNFVKAIGRRIHRHCGRRNVYFEQKSCGDDGRGFIFLFLLVRLPGISLKIFHFHFIQFASLLPCS